jgi:hypothetical protein
MGISHTLLLRWKKKFDILKMNFSSGKEKQIPLREEMSLLRKEIGAVTERVDILSKIVKKTLSEKYESFPKDQELMQKPNII